MRYVSIFFLVTLFVARLSAQMEESSSSFKYATIHKDLNIGMLSYTGRSMSIADTDTAAVPGFEFLSVGRIKKIETLSTGCVFVKIVYGGNQMLVFEGRLYNADNYNFSDTWFTALTQFSECNPLSTRKVKNNKLMSATYQKSEKLRIHLINIRPESLELFKYMVSTVDLL